MISYSVRQLALFVLVFIGSTFLVFTLIFAMPGDPIRALSGFRPQPPEVNRALREQYNLNDPLIVQYLKYLRGVLSLDLGSDFRGREVWGLIRSRLPESIRLLGVAAAGELAIGLIAGLTAAVFQGRWVDRMLNISMLVMIATPVLVLADATRSLLGVELGWIDWSVGRREGWRGSVVPGLILGATSTAALAQVVRASIVDNQKQMYLLLARAKGLTHRRIVGVHALRNSMVAGVTLVGADVGAMFGRLVVVEIIFGIPGVGTLLIEAVRAQETPVVLGVTTFLVAVFTITNLATDLVNGLIDPRVRESLI